LEKGIIFSSSLIGHKFFPFCKASEMKMQEPSSTYEATQARQRTQAQPDKVHWDGEVSFRDHPYRQLHHQRGIIGAFRIRLLEASNLKRSYWSPLAIGPVKLLGLSKAHGNVSSFCSFSLDTASAYGTDSPAPSTSNRKPAPTSKPPPKRPTVVSPVIPENNNPVWDNFQFDFPLRKGFMAQDGMRLLLTVRVNEDSTPVETLMPGGSSDGDARLLGMGSLDITDLCLGCTREGDPVPGVIDAWIPISLPDKNRLPVANENEDSNVVASSEPPPSTGMVRVLVSYGPSGLEPHEKDIVALETFARRNPSTSSCRPLLPPLRPLTVVERRGAFLLCEYSLSDQGRKKAFVRLHRNSVFVIERQNLADAAHNLALLPFDVMMSTPIGRASAQTLAPVGAASKELLMPALLSLKLLWVAARTTTLAGLSGAQALGSTLWQEGSTSLTASHHSDSNLSLRGHDHYRNHRDGALSQFAQL
jgi:hypothetical protein